jgi:hypothetical protein
LYNFPLSYQEQSLQDFFGLQPTEVRGSANVTTSYYGRILYNIILSLFKIGIPEKGLAMKIPKNYLRYWLFLGGSYTTIYTQKFGWVISPYSTSEFDFYFQPKQIVVNNRFLDSTKVGLVGVNCEIVRLFDDYRGVTPIINQYADKLAACDKAIEINLMLTGLGKLVGTRDKKDAEAIKAALSQLTMGLPIATLNKEVLDEYTVSNLVADISSPFIGDKVHDLKRSIMNDLLTTIGVNNANINKRERLNSDEVNANNDEVRTLYDVMFENLKDSFKRVEDVSGLKFTVEKNFNKEAVNALVNQSIGGGVANE